MTSVLVGYPHFLGIAARLQWDADGLDLGEDARRWPDLSPARRDRVIAFVAGFALAEDRVAVDLQPFIAAAPNSAMAECFRAQAGDEERHAGFFDRYRREVLRIEAAALRDAVDPRFAELFERSLGDAARSLATGELRLADAVRLYHLVLEGIVFSAGQRALLAELQTTSELPGLRAGLERVIADERWHIGFGVRILRGDWHGSVAQLADERQALEVWGDLLSEDQRRAALRQHRRRLSAAGIAG